MGFGSGVFFRQFDLQWCSGGDAVEFVPTNDGIVGSEFAVRGSEFTVIMKTSHEIVVDSAADRHTIVSRF